MAGRDAARVRLRPAGRGDPHGRHGPARGDPDGLRSVTGVTAVDVRLEPRDAAVRPPPAVTVSAVLPTAGHAVPGLPAVRVSGDVHHVDGLPLMMPGRWEFLVTVDGDGPRERLVFPLTVSP
ncbi:hypothetical protein ACIBCT_22930 [Streptosporangium sp. NPDC050855]|uniref:hypothetical protein n=1 Tax=Streptosporangium sp. NPDC050855 TaxID=3366194 RepID=UPI0037BC5D2B